MKKTLGGILLAALAMLVLVAAFAEVYAPVNRTTLGFSVEPSSAGAPARVAYLSPKSDAYRQGVRSGDLVDVMAMPFGERLRLELHHSPPGTAVDVPFIHNGVRRVVTIRAYVPPGSEPQPDWAFLLNAVITLLIVAVIALRKPSTATAALVLYGMGAITTGNFTTLFSGLHGFWFSAIALSIVTAFSSVPAAALLPFIARFPEVPNTPAGRMRVRAADAIFWLSVAVFTVQTLYEPLIFISWTTFDLAAPFALLLLALLFAAFVYRDSGGEARRRIGWVIAGVAVSAAGYAVFNVIDSVVLAQGTPGPATRFLADASQLLQSALPIALAYAVLRHRVLDIGFALNRTMVYGAMTALAIVVVSLVDWLTGRMLSEQRLALAVEAAVTIGFGFALNWLHAKTERLIDRIVFRARHIAEKRIEYRIGALAFASSASAVDDAAGVEAAHILSLASAAVFTRLASNEAFSCKSSTGWENAPLRALDEDALLVRTLRSLERPIVLDDAAIHLDGAPHGHDRPMVAIPIVAQHELQGFALYGNRRDGALPDPEEIALLAKLCAAAGNAYGAVEARQWRERAAMLERSLLDDGRVLPA